MLWLGMILFGIFILLLAWKMTQSTLSPWEHQSQKKKTTSKEVGEARKTPPLAGIGTKPQQPTPSPRCMAYGSTMLETSKIAGPFFSKGTLGDTMGKCMVNIQRIPSLDAASRGANLPVSRRQLPDPADPNNNKNGVDTINTNQEQEDKRGRDSRTPQTNRLGTTQPGPPTRWPEADNRGTNRTQQ